MMLLCVAFLLSAHLVSCQADSSSPFTSIFKLENLFKKEEFVVEQLEKYLIENPESQIHSVLKTYVNEYKFMKNSSQTSKDFVMHPINAFHFLRRVAIVWTSIENKWSNTSMEKDKEVIQQLISYRNQSSYPSMEDVMGTVVGIARIQDTYLLKTKDLVEGIIRTKNKKYISEEPMDAWDCVWIGQGAIAIGAYKTAMEWKNAAEKLVIEWGDRSVTREQIQSSLHIEPCQEEDGVDTQTEETDQNSKQFLGDHKAEAESKLELGSARAHPPLENSFCREEQYLVPSHDTTLLCYYLTRGDPYLYIGPFKAEEKSSEPPILVFHDFVYQSEMDLFKEIGVKNMSRSKTAYNETDKQQTLERTSQQSWLMHNDEPPKINKVSLRIEHATGLRARDVFSSEDYQIANYGIGGVFDSHSDYLNFTYASQPFGYKEFTTRIATVMLYLEDVPAGGATSFLYSMVTVLPEKGAAVFWYNTKKNLEEDMFSLHAGCPVLYGSKWIANKWIRAGGQAFIAKCGKDRDEWQELPRHLDLKGLSPSHDQKNQLRHQKEKEIQQLFLRSRE